MYIYICIYTSISISVYLSIYLSIYLSGSHWKNQVKPYSSSSAASANAIAHRNQFLNTNRINSFKTKVKSSNPV